MPKPTPALIIQTASILAAGGISTAASIRYEVESSPDVSVTGSDSSPAEFNDTFLEDVSDALSWQEAVNEVTADHRSMDAWEREATESFIDSLFE